MQYFQQYIMIRSLGLSDAKTSIDRQAVKELKKAIVKTCLECQHSYSVLALDTHGQIVGVKLGYLVNKGRLRRLSRQKEYVPWLRHVYWAMPTTLVNYNIVSWHSEVQLGYHPAKVLKELGGDSMFEGEVLGVAKSARGLGLGKGMVNLSMAIARRLGCQYYFACVSGVYSQKIYRDLGFTVMRELIYADVKDRKGNAILTDTREHTKAQNVYLRLQ